MLTNLGIGEGMLMISNCTRIGEVRRTENRNQVIKLARVVVAHVAPTELTLFEATCDAYFASSSRARTGRRRTSEIEFDGQQIVPLITTAALSSTISVLQFLASKVGETAFEEAGVRAWIRRLLRRFFGFLNRFHPAVHRRVDTQPLSPEQLANVRTIAVREASAFDLTEDKAALIADAIVGQLALSDCDGRDE